MSDDLKTLIRLETEQGEYVGTGEILKMLKPPAIVVLGQRFFQHYEGNVYREAFMTAVLRTVPNPNEGEVAIEPDERCPLDDGRFFNQLPQLYKEQGDARMCLYCGSMHVDDFKAMLPNFIDPEKPYWYVELNDRKDKLYLRRPGNRNSDDGPIKFKLAHLQGQEHADVLIEKINEAIQAGHVKHETVILPELRARIDADQGVGDGN
jgi:hypothetical protein